MGKFSRTSTTWTPWSSSCFASARSKAKRRASLEGLWIKNVTITTGLVDTFSTPRLLSMLAAGRLELPGLITHRFGLDEVQDAYDTFSRPAETGALKVALFTEAGIA